MNCQNCNEPLIMIRHREVDGDDYTDVIDWECVENNCIFPNVPDEWLTPEELKERGKVDTMTEFNIYQVEV